MQIPMSEIKVGKKLGTGLLPVDQADWMGTTVVLKTLAIGKLGDALERQFETETQVMQQLRHRNVVMLYGVTEDKERRSLVKEYCSKGTLHQLIHSEFKIPTEKLWKMAADIAAGLQYIHSRDFIHSNFTSTKILVAEDGTLKITGFGLTKVKDYISRTYMEIEDNRRGTPAWMAPELFLPKGRLTQKADVYGMGVIFWELAARKIPWSECTSLEEFYKKKQTEWRPKMEGSWPTTFQHIIHLCWQGNRRVRPAARQVHSLVTLGRKKPDLSLQEVKAKIDPSAKLVAKGIKLRHNFRKEKKGSLAEAFKLFEQAAKAGNLEGSYQLGRCYEEGKGTKRNLMAAKKWYTSASDRNHVPSAYRLGHLLGAEGKHQEALAHFKKGADQQHGNSEWMYGFYLYTGKGGKRSSTEGFAYIKRAADQGVKEAAYRCGRMYSTGIGTKKNFPEAVTYLKLAADRRHPRAAFYLAEIYQKGEEGVAKNEGFALRYFREAASKALFG